jgi:hypothetical protein
MIGYRRTLLPPSTLMMKAVWPPEDRDFNLHRRENLEVSQNQTAASHEQTSIFCENKIPEYQIIFK